MSRFLGGMVVGALLLFTAMSFHIVRGKNGTVLVPKIDRNLSDVYVDIRDYDLQDWDSHRPLAAAILKSNQAHLVPNARPQSIGDSVVSLLDRLAGK